MSLAFNYLLTSNALNSFATSSSGGVQGTALDAPAVRYQLAGGTLDSTETLPMWGGVGISELIPGGSTQPVGPLGTRVKRANTLTAATTYQLTGWSVFDQNYSAANTPQSNVPLVGTGGSVNFYRLRSLARIWVAIAPGLTGSAGGLITENVSWDFTNQQLIPGIAAYASLTATSATYNSTTGALAITFPSAPFGASIGTGANGVYISMSGFTGTGSVASLNGDFPITGTATAGTVVTVQAPVGLTLTITGGTGTLAAGGGYLPVQVLDLNIGSGMIVNYSATSGFATWGRTGNLAVIQI